MGKLEIARELFDKMPERNQDFWQYSSDQQKKRRGRRLTTTITMELTSSETDFAAKAATGPDASEAGEIDALIRSEFKIKSSHGGKTSGGASQDCTR
ncbi:hypothetical protein L1887_18089 [Cichorium endivia]|nr:hypothetical protein L1887_18089 [Cichorium endivia]